MLLFLIAVGAVVYGFSVLVLFGRRWLFSLLRG
jgi:putative peptidoglycan lipid II flippase